MIISLTESFVPESSAAAFSIRLRRKSDLNVNPVVLCTAALRYEIVTPYFPQLSVKLADVGNFLQFSRSAVITSAL